MNIPNPGSVLWMTGLDNFSFRYIESENFIDAPTDVVKFISTSPDSSEDFIFLLEFYEYALENLEEAKVLKPGSVVDGAVKGIKLRFIIGQLSLEETAEYIYNAPQDYNIIILSRPAGTTKAGIEQLVSELGRLWINVPMPKASNISKTVTKKKRWTKECFFRNLTKIGCQILWGIITNLLTPIVGGYIQNLNNLKP